MSAQVRAGRLLTKYLHLTRKVSSQVYYKVSTGDRRQESERESEREMKCVFNVDTFIGQIVSEGLRSVFVCGCCAGQN